MEQNVNMLFYYGHYNFIVGINMPEWLVNTCFMLSDFIQGVIQGLIIAMLFNKKPGITKLLIFGFIISMIITLPTFFIQYPIEIRMILYFLIMTLAFRFIISTDYFTAVFGSLLLLGISAVVEYICLAIMKLSLSVNVEINFYEMPHTIRLVLKNKAVVMLLIILGIVYYTKISINTSEDINIKKMLRVLLNIAIVVILTIPNLLYISRMYNHIGLNFILFNVAMTSVLIALNIYNARIFAELNVQKQKIEYQKQYINSLTDAIDGLRGFKHDFNNIMNVINGYITLDDFEGLKKYFNQLQNNYRAINNVFPLCTYVQEDPAIYGLLLSKISTAEAKNITFSININARLKSNQLKSMELYKIIGILLDNAFEAAEETEEKFVELFVRDLDDDGVLIEISNSTINNGIDITRIYQKGYSTKSQHTGFGLWEVKKIVSKSKNCEIKTFVNGNIFTQQLKLY